MKKILLGSVVVGLMLVSSMATSACVCTSLPNPTPEQIRAQLAYELKNARIVFSGEVIQLDKFTVKFKIEKVWKGDIKEEIILSTGTRDIGNNRIIWSSCDHWFERGGKYLVYAQGSGEEMQANSCGGTGKIGNSEQRIEFLAEDARRGSSEIKHNP